ncbi:ParA family protein [Sinorhizobium sp. B11]
MPILTFANTKGGAGKTTVALVLATELARRGHRVSVLDADPQQWATRWHRLTGDAAEFAVVPGVSENTIEQQVKDLKKRGGYIIVDLPAGLSPAMAKAIGFSDHVLVPVQGCAMDAAGGAQVLEIMKQLAAQHDIRIPHSVVLTRISSIITTRALLAVKGLLAKQQVNIVDTALIERAAYRDMFVSGGSLYTMDPARVSNLDKAQDNARMLADDVLRLAPPKAARAKSARKVAEVVKNAA